MNELSEAQQFSYQAVAEIEDAIKHLQSAMNHIGYAEEATENDFEFGNGFEVVSEVIEAQREARKFEGFVGQATVIEAALSNLSKSLESEAGGVVRCLDGGLDHMCSSDGSCVHCHKQIGANLEDQDNELAAFDEGVRIAQRLIEKGR